MWEASSSSHLKESVRTGQDLGQLASGFAGPDQVDEYLAEDVGMGAHGGGQGLAALDVLDQAGHHFPEAGIFDGVPQVGQPFEDGDAGPGELFQVEAEIDQFAAGNLAGPE